MSIVTVLGWVIALLVVVLVHVWSERNRLKAECEHIRKDLAKREDLYERCIESSHKLFFDYVDEMNARIRSWGEAEKLTADLDRERQAKLAAQHGLREAEWKLGVIKNQTGLEVLMDHEWPAWVPPWSGTEDDL